jgi:hypothetical protein
MNKIQALIGGIALVAAGAASAQADWHIASPGMSSNTVGNTTYHSDGSTSSNYGGNTTYHSDGSTSRQSGNTTYHSDGTTCRSYGSRTSC